jgi:hypothetical protein
MKAAMTDARHPRMQTRLIEMMKPTSDPLDFLAELIMRLMPGRIGKAIAWIICVVCFVIGAAVFVLELIQAISR